MRGSTASVGVLEPAVCSHTSFLSGVALVLQDQFLQEWRAFHMQRQLYSENFFRIASRMASKNFFGNSFGNGF